MKSPKQPIITDHDWHFLRGGGEMGALLRAKDWSTTFVGSPEQWPQSLRTALSIMLGSKFPMFLWWGADLTCFYNDAYRPSLGKDGKHPDILGQKAEDAWPEIWDVIKPLIDQVLAGGEATWSEDQLIPIYRNGTMENVWWTFSYSPVNDETGNVAGVFVTCFETTEKVENMRKLQASDQRFQNMVREANIGIIVLSGENYIVDVVNDAYGKLIERTPAELLGNPLFNIIPDAEDPFRGILDKVRLTGEPVYLYTQPYLVYKNAKKIEGFIDVIYQPYKEADGTITGVITIVSDVTERVLSRKKIDEAEARARMAINSADLGTYAIDLVTNEIVTSERFNSIWGISTANTEWSTLLARIHPDDLSLRGEAYRQSKISGHINYEARVIWEDQSIHWVKVQGKALFDEANNIVSLVGVIQDITEQKQFAAQLTTQVKERTIALQRSNDDLMQFAHVISHDLKEPIRKIRIYSNRISEEMADAIPAKAVEYLSKIKNSTSRIYDMIDGVLNYSTLSASNEGFQSVDLNEVIKSIQTDLEILIHQKSASLVYNDLPTVHGAYVLIYQLFYNLINNSLKFSRITLTPVISIDASHGSDFTEIRVTDNGIGFEQQYADSIFGSFFRLNSKDNYEGTGLGLALSKKIVERHGGTISATASPNNGACIIIKLPHGTNPD